MLATPKLISLCLLSFLIMSSAGASTRSEMYRTQALFAFSEKAYDEALIQLDLAVQDDAKDMHARYYRGVTFSRLGRYQEAIQDLEMARSYELPYKDLLFELGFAYYRSEQLEPAQRALEESVKKRPKHAPSQYYLGLAYYQAKRYQDCLEPLKIAAALEKKFGGVASYLRGESLVRLKRNTEARQVLEMSVELYPESIYINPSRELLSRISATKDVKKLKLMLSLGWGYDDNITLDNDSAEATGYDDTRTQLGLSATYQLFDNKQYAFSAGYHLFQSLHQDFDTYDVQSHTLSLDLRRRIEGGSLGVGYQLNKTTLDNNNYLVSNTINPYLIKSHEGSRLSMLRLLWRNNNYLNTAPDDRDGKTRSVHYRHYWINENIQQNRVYLGGKWQDEGSKEDNVAYNVFNAEIGAQRQWRQFRITGRASIERKDYSKSDTGRIDKRRDVSLGIGVPLAKDLEFEVMATHTWNPSNQAVNDYNRSTVFGTLRWRP